MKSTTMVAQITTQEDVLFAGITFRQLVIWMMGGIVAIAIYILLPQPAKLNAYKLLLILTVGVVTVTSSVRYRGVLLLDRWLLRFQFMTRPRVVTE